MAEPRPSDSFILRFEELAQATSRRPAVDVALRALDMLFSLLFLLLSLPLWVPLSLVIRITSGPPLFYRGERVGRGGRVFTCSSATCRSSGRGRSDRASSRSWPGSCPPTGSGSSCARG